MRSSAVSPVIAALFAVTGTPAALAQPAPASGAVGGGPVVDPGPAPENDTQTIDFAADLLDYDSDADIVTATGNVEAIRQGSRVNADRITWNRVSGRVIAEGDVTLHTVEGDTVYGDQVELTDTLKDGVIQNMLVVFDNGGRVAARQGSLTQDVAVLDYAAYSPCPVVDTEGCPREPVWQIKARQVRHDPVRNRIFYRDARLEILGLPVLALPHLSHPDGSEGGGSGLLVPDVRISRRNGLEVALPYYHQIAPDADITITPHLYTDVLPALEVNYRRLTDYGPFQIGGMITHGSRLRGFDDTDGNRDVRAYFHANGQFQFTPQWRLTFASRLASDDTFLRRYDITRDDRLRNFAEMERFGDETYLSIAGWATQTLRFQDRQGAQPIALPMIDFRWNPSDRILGGRLAVEANTLGLTRTDGQDTRRALASVKWDMRATAPGGQRVTLTGFLRGDIYHSENNLSTDVVAYRGRSGVQTRGIAAVAVDLDWPLAGPLFGGQQVITPRVQFVASPPIRNAAIPNEDARAFDLEDSNLFALNRFPGYDRWEDSARITYGADWSLDLPSIAIRANIGQSYRLNDKPSIFPDGTGLTDRFSDYVGRTTVRYRDFVSLTHRYRLDKDNLAVRRNEIDATIGSRQTYATIGYLRLNRDINLEDLGDREELRFGARWKFARYWSVFGSTIVDLTSRAEDPFNTSDGFEPVRHRFGIAYEDECLELGVTWRKDYTATGDGRTGSTYLIRLSLKNLGRR